MTNHTAEYREGQKQCFRMSRFNILYENKNTIYLYNTFTGAFASVKPEYQKLVTGLIRQQYPSINLQDLPVDLADGLQQGGYIIPSEFDEMKYLKTLNKVWRFGSPSLSLTICPTLECNFDCSYCYEGRDNRKGRMNDGVAESMVRFIEKECEERIKKLNIVWYGGEPLLELPRIESTMSAINAICHKWNVKIGVVLVSNGYLLDEVYLSRLKKCGISAIQVTIDGPPDVHNRRRKLSDGRGTFETIYNNIINALQFGIHISIRINTDKQNISSLPILFEILAKNDFIRTRALPYLGQTISVPYSCGDFPDGYCLSTPQYARERYLMQRKLLEFGFKSGIKPQPKANFCLSIGNGAYAIDPFGNLYKCWMDIGSVECAVGSLERNGDLKIDKVKILQWLAYNPFVNTKCGNCRILPLCAGGCYYYPIRLGKKRCSDLKYRLKEYLFLYVSQIGSTNGTKERR